MSIEQIQKQIVDEFSGFTDWLEKYNYLIELGKELTPLPDEMKTDRNLIQGCQSRVWLYAQFDNGLIDFKADSDAIITKGIVGLLIRVFSHHTPDEILNTDISFIDQIGLKENLSPTRSNGLVAMIKQIKMYALAYKAKMEKL